MKIRIRHRTTYTYAELVTLGQHKVMIRPREGHDLHIESSILEIYPRHRIQWMRDVNGNCIACVDFFERASQLVISSEIVLNQYDLNPFDFQMDASAVGYPFTYEPDAQPELATFLTIHYARDLGALRQWLSQFWKPGEQIQTLDLLQRLNRHINQTFRYLRRDEPGVQTPAETLARQSGSCRDFATLFAEACRCWGMAARFVSGYMQCPASEAGGASTHAWAEVYLPGAGWKGFDPTSGIVTGEKHVAVAVSRDPERAAPIAGSFVGPANAFLRIGVDVRVEQIDTINDSSLAEPFKNTSPARPVCTQQQVQQLPQMAMCIQPPPPPLYPLPSTLAAWKPIEKLAA